jgi:hypothetical protein
MPRFIDEEIVVKVTGEMPVPTEFTWRADKHDIVRIVFQWPDWGFAAGSSQRNWRTRRHRNYYRVETTDGDLWEIYLDRNTPDGSTRWFLYQQLDREPVDDPERDPT